MKNFNGVNLGGWFVLESWIKPSLFENIDSKDETGYCLKNKHAQKDLIEHWETFITLKDFLYLKQLGITHVRLPIPWWLQGESPYFSSLPYIHQAMKWAEEAQINVLLDLHTAPGCQNGFDNGGIEGVMTWHLDPKNIDLTITKLAFIAETFHHYSSFWGIQVLNEPFLTIDLDLIVDFYERAYLAIRKNTNKIIVFHDAFRPLDKIWTQFFKDKKKTNVMFDLHLYHCFDPKLINGEFIDHINVMMKKRLPMIKKLSKMADIIIGEWSLGINYQKLKKDDTFNEELYNKILASLQLYIYSYAKGQFFWNYRVESGRDGWNFEKLVSLGILPNHYE